MGLMNKLSKMKSFLFDEEDEEKEVRKPSKKIVKKEEEKEDFKTKKDRKGRGLLL